MNFTAAILSLVVFAYFPSIGLADSWEKMSASEFSLPNPPDSKQRAVEIDTLLKLQNERTKEECALGEKQRAPTILIRVFNLAYSCPADRNLTRVHTLSFLRWTRASSRLFFQTSSWISKTLQMN